MYYTSQIVVEDKYFSGGNKDRRVPKFFFSEVPNFIPDMMVVTDGGDGYSVTDSVIFVCMCQFEQLITADYQQRIISL